MGCENYIMGIIGYAIPGNIRDTYRNNILINVESPLIP